MFFRLRPEARSPILMVVVGCAVVGLVLWVGLRQKKLEWDAKKAAVAPCIAAGTPVSVCHARIGDRSAECFLLNYTSSSRYRPEGFDQAGFDECATGEASPKEWSAKRGAANRALREADAEQRRQLNRELNGP